MRLLRKKNIMKERKERGTSKKLGYPPDQIEFEYTVTISTVIKNLMVNKEIKG